MVIHHFALGRARRSARSRKAPGGGGRILIAWFYRGARNRPAVIGMTTHPRGDRTTGERVQDGKEEEGGGRGRERERRGGVKGVKSRQKGKGRRRGIKSPVHRPRRRRHGRLEADSCRWRFVSEAWSTGQLSQQVPVGHSKSGARERLAAEYIGREYRVHGHDALALHAGVRWTTQPPLLIRPPPSLASAESASAGRGSRAAANRGVLRAWNSLVVEARESGAACHDGLWVVSCGEVHPVGEVESWSRQALVWI